MSADRLASVFERRRAAGQGVLVTYLCAGFPDLETSVAVALACVEGGADVLEIGCPFSDPTTDGEVIARASTAALRRGGGLASALEVAARVRAASDVPIVLFGYYNPIFVAGERETVQRASEAGVDAFLVVDLPPEEDQELGPAATDLGLGVVPLVAPTTSEARIARLAALRPPPPFVYCVSVNGVTGGAADGLSAASSRARAAGDRIGVPAVVGFGVTSPSSAREAGSEADGVVVGSALVRVVEEAAARGLTPERTADLVREATSPLALAVHTSRAPLPSTPSAPRT